MKTIFVNAVLVVPSVLFAPGSLAQTADECIAEYESQRSQFEATAADAQVNCVKQGNLLSLEREGPFPDFCRDKGPWDHWHLEARATGNKEGACKMMLRGQQGVEGCGTEEVVIELPANEAATWRRYLQQECRN